MRMIWHLWNPAMILKFEYLGIQFAHPGYASGSDQDANVAAHFRVSLLVSSVLTYQRSSASHLWSRCTGTGD